MKQGKFGILISFIALNIGSLATAATLFVDSTGTGGAYTTIEAAFAAASANDIIYVRGGQTFTPTTLNWGTAKSGIKLYGGWNGDQITPLSNADISPNTAGNLALANASRLPETIINGTTFAHIANTGGSSVAGATIRGFSIATSGNAIEVAQHVTATVSDLDISHNILTLTSGQGINFQQAYNCTANGVLLSGNRITFAVTASARTALQLGPASPTLSNVTVIGNYFVDQAPGTGNNRAINADGASRVVVAGNLFDSMSNQSAGNFLATKDVVIAENEFLGAGKTERAIIFAPKAATAGDRDVERFLISNNTFDKHKFQPIDLTVAGSFGTFTGDDGAHDIWIRHNKVEQDVAIMQAAGLGVSVLSLRFHENTEGNGPVEISHNEINLTGNRTNWEMQAIRIAGQAPTSATGGMLIQNNLIVATNATGSITHVGVRIAPGFSTSFGTMGQISALISNNTISGFLSAGVGVYSNNATASTPPSIGALAVGSTAHAFNNNILNNGIGVQAGNGEFVNISGSYFSGNTVNTSGNTTGSAGSSPYTVPGRDPNYVTFRGDHNLDNVVNAADKAVIVANFGLKGPGITYFHGDSSLDQKISLLDGAYWARFQGANINSSGTFATSNPGGSPIFDYDSTTGLLRMNALNVSDIWGVRIVSNWWSIGSVNLAPGTLGWTLWATNSVEFGDANFGSTFNFAPTNTWVNLAYLQTGIPRADFGPIEYFYGYQSTVGFGVTSLIPEPSTVLLLCLGGGLLWRRYRRS